MNKILLTAVTLLLLILAQCHFSCSPDYSITVKNKTIKVEIADTDELRMKGLMFRESLPDDSGMLFIFPEENIRHFWMKNTSLPLSIAYVASTGIIIDIKDLQPHNLNSVPSAGPAQYAIEVNQGWFARNGVKPGDQIIFSPDITNKYIK